jgi:hypothetical protein
MRGALPEAARRAIQRPGGGPGMNDRKMTDAQRAYEAKRAAKAGMSLEKWLVEKDKRAAAEAKAAEQAAKAAAASAAAPKKPGFFGRLLERAQKPL